MDNIQNSSIQHPIFDITFCEFKPNLESCYTDKTEPIKLLGDTFSIHMPVMEITSIDDMLLYMEKYGKEDWMNYHIQLYLYNEILKNIQEKN